MEGGVTGTTAGLLVSGTWGGAQSVFHSREYPPPPASPAVSVKPNFAKTASLSAWGPLSSPVD